MRVPCSVNLTQVPNLDPLQEPISRRLPSLENIPVEILTTIFKFALIHNHAFVVILAQISQRLRRIVVSEPLLWSSLSLSTGRNPQAKVKLWLSRNNGLLRGLYLRDYDEEVQEAVEALHSVTLDGLRVLSVKNYERRRLQIDLPLLTPRAIANLHSLTLDGCGCDWQDGTSDLKLRLLSIRNTNNDWARLANHSTHLRYLRYEGSLTSDVAPAILSLLRRNPHLISIKLGFKRRARVMRTSVPLTFPYHPHHTSAPIELPNLTTLILGEGGMLKANDVIPFLSLPNLRHLELDGLQGAWSDTIRNLIAAKAVSHLESLAIIYRSLSIPSEIRCRSDLLVELLHQTPRLRLLELYRVTHVRGVLRALADESLALCPQLKILDISQCPLVDDELLEAIVRTRNCTNSDSSCASTQAVPTMGKLYRLIIGISSTSEMPSVATICWLRECVPRVTWHCERKRLTPKTR